MKPRINRDLNSAKMHLWSKFENLEQVISNVLDKPKIGSILSLKLHLTLKVNVKNNRDRNQGVLLPWTKFGDPSLNR